MSKGPDSVTSTTNTEPPAFIKGPLTTAVDAAQSQFLPNRTSSIVPNSQNLVNQTLQGGFLNSGNPNAQQFLNESVQGGMIGDPTSQQFLKNSVRGDFLNSGDPVSQGLLNKTAQGGFLNSNPHLDATFNRAADLTQTRLASQFAGSGRDLAASRPARSDELQTLASNIYGGNYQAERDRQMAAGGQLGQNYQAGLNRQAGAASELGSNALAAQNQQLGAAGMLGGNYQAERDRQSNAVNQGQQMDPLNMFINRLSGLIPGAGGSTQSTQPVYQTGLFSDRRLKRNIRRIGTKAGYPWYSFEYLWGQKAEGHMSDEIPSQFVSKAFGFDVVDYARMH